MGSDETGTSTPGQHGLRVERSVPSHSDHRWMEEQRDLIQEALLEGEERLQTLLEDAMAAVYLKDLQGRYLTANCWAEIMFRITLEEAVGKTDHELWPKEVADALRANDLKALEAGAPLRFDQFFLHEDGEYVYEASKFPLYDAAGDLYAVCGIATNVTKLKKTEEALRRQNEQLEALNETTLALMNRLESDDLLENILERAEALVGTSHGCINLVVEPGGDEMERRFGTGFFSRSVGERIKAGVGLAGKVLQTGERLVVEDYSSWPGRRPDIDSSPLRAAVGVPLRSGPRVAGVIALVRVQDESGFGDEDVEVLSRFAELASLVLDNAQLHDSAQRELAERERAEKELREREERFRALVQNSSDVVTVLDESGAIIYVSPSVERVLGYRPEERIVGNAFDHVHPDEIERVKSAYAEAAKDIGGIGGPQEFRMRHADGSWRYVETIRNNLLDEPSVRGIVANLRDVTERKEAEEALRESEERYRAVMEQSAESIWLFDPETKCVLESNDSFQELLGHTSQELLEMTIYDFIAHERDAIDASVRSDLWERQRFVGERKFRRKDGSLIDIEVSMTVIPYHGREAVCGVARDVTERKALEEQLRRRALYDPLTELPNRVLFLERVGHALARTDRLDEPVAVLFVDLDDFKVINDSLGHDAGNALLVDVARRLRTCVRPGDTVARLFGDEFAVLLEAPAELDDARRVAERIGECLQQKPFVLDGREAFVTTSIGIALGDSAGDEPKDVLRRADLAMYTAKKGRKARYEVFQPSMGDRAVERLDLENQLRRAIEREEFEVHYQPVIELRSGKINGVEALVRWRHPERGLVFPKEFIVLAEETGLIRPIGQWVLEEACRQAMQWRERYPDKALLMSVNLSTSQFGYQPDLISGVLNDTGMDPQNLQLEITERVVMDDAEALGKLRRLKDLGVRFAIDDYGTGYSSLSYLKRMPVSVLKIDHAFVAGLGRDWGDEAIVAGTVSLAHVLGLEVVAEGVETEDQLAKLEELECDMAQGFYLGKPLPGEAIQSLLGL